MSREDWRMWKFKCVNCISYESDGLKDEGVCGIAEHVVLPPWAVERKNRTVNWNDSCDLFESDSVEVKP